MAWTFLPMTLCIIAAGTLALAGKDGWGWFLFAALVLTPTVHSSSGG